MTTIEITESSRPAVIADNDIVFLDFWAGACVARANQEAEVVR